MLPSCHKESSRQVPCQYSLSIFQTLAVSCLARRDLCSYLPMFCDCSALRVLVVFDIHGVYVYKIFEDKAKRQYSISMFETLAVSCLARRDLCSYLPLFCDCSALRVLVAFDIHGVYEVFEDKAKEQYSISIFETLAVSCLARRDLCSYLPLFCDYSALRVLVAFDIHGVYKVFEDKAKEQYSISIFETLAVSCLARRDLCSYLPLFCDCSAMRVLVAFDIHGVYVYKVVFEDKAKKQYSLSIFQTPAVSCLVSRHVLSNVSREQLTF